MKNKLTRKDIPTFKLALSYLVIIMVMSITSSLVFYATSARELNRKPDAAYYSQTSFKDPDHELDEWLGRRADAGRGDLLMNLVTINAVILLGGSVLSYILARRTLRPIEQAMQAQNRFIADASHELRTPLTSILLSNEVALRREQLSDGDARKIIKQNIEDINYLKTLTDNLLDLTTLSHTQPELTNTNLNDIVEAAITRVRPAADKKQIKIATTITVENLHTNKPLLEKILVILLENAVKYSQKKTVTTVSAEHRANRTLIHVQDQGEGIHKVDIPNIFNRFYRSSESRSQKNGYGLGLAIAKQIADNLGYIISIDSIYGAGSTFTIEIPNK